MQVVYWSHSYREEDARINEHFGTLIERAEKMIVNFDPPSETSVNSAKLAQNLRSCDGMIAILGWRATGPSKYILYEIGLCLSARKPLIIFVDDRLPDNVLPPRILQRRFSHKTYFRQFREHVASLEILKTYLGTPPPTRYQPSFGRRTCGLIGSSALGRELRDQILSFVERRWYRSIELEKVQTENPLLFDSSEFLSNMDLAINCVDATTYASVYWTGAVAAAGVPMITFTMNDKFAFSDAFPREFQPKLVENQVAVQSVLEAEFELYEQNFLSVDNADAIARYTKLQLAAGELGGNYEAGTRRQFTEVIMGDQYKNISGQVGAFGPNAHDMVFNQTWNKVENSVDLNRLAEELGRLHKALEQQATEPDQKLAAGAIAAAEQSARQKDGPKALQYLKMGGKWALDIASQIGVDVAKAAITAALGIG